MQVSSNDLPRIADRLPCRSGRYPSGLDLPVVPDAARRTGDESGLPFASPRCLPTGGVTPLESVLFGKPPNTRMSAGACQGLRRQGRFRGSTNRAHREARGLGNA